MKTINEKQLKQLSMFLIISGLGAVWLSFAWKHLSSSAELGAVNFAGIHTFIYYVFNSVLLLTCGITLQLKQFKLFSYLSLCLCVAVSVSFFIFQKDSNLFIYTTIVGMSMGLIEGGTILVPMFLISIYKSAYLGFLYFKKKLVFEGGDKRT